MLERLFFERLSELLPNLKITLMERTTASQAFSALNRLWDAYPHRYEPELIESAMKHALERFTTWNDKQTALVAQMCLLTTWSEHAEGLSKSFKAKEVELMQNLKVLVEKAEKDE